MSLVWMKQQEKWFMARCFFFLTTCCLVVVAVSHYQAHQSRLCAWIEKIDWRVVTGWGMSSFISNRTEKTQDCITYKSHYTQEFLFVKTHWGRILIKKRKVMALVSGSAASRCALRHVSTLYKGTQKSIIIFPLGIWISDNVVIAL